MKAPPVAAEMSMGVVETLRLLVHERRHEQARGFGRRPRHRLRTVWLTPLSQD